jgi:hypothetical protein
MLSLRAASGKVYRRRVSVPVSPILTDFTIREKAAARALQWTEHAAREAVADCLWCEEVEAALGSAEMIEHYSDRHRCLVRATSDAMGDVHVVLDYADWCADAACGLVIVTVYRPDPAIWIDRRTRRR